MREKVEPHASINKAKKTIFSDACINAQPKDSWIFVFLSAFSDGTHINCNLLKTRRKKRKKNANRFHRICDQIYDYIFYQKGIKSFMDFIRENCSTALWGFSAEMFCNKFIHFVCTELCVGEKIVIKYSTVFIFFSYNKRWTFFVVVCFKCVNVCSVFVSQKEHWRRPIIEIKRINYY